MQLFFAAPPRPKDGKLSIRRVRMWNFTRIGPKTKKLWLSIAQVQWLSEQPGLGPPQKGVNCNFFRRNSTSRTALESYPSRTLKYAVSAGLAKRWKKYSSFKFLVETEKFLSTDHSGAAREGSTIFLCRSSFGSMAMESCRLPELKYAIFSRAERKTKKLPRSKLFLYSWCKNLVWPLRSEL